MEAKEKPAHKAIWARYDDANKMKVKIQQLGYSTETSFISDLVGKTNEEIKKFLAKPTA